MTKDTKELSKSKKKLTFLCLSNIISSKKLVQSLNLFQMSERESKNFTNKEPILSVVIGVKTAPLLS